MNKMNVFKRPSEQDTEKEVSHRYENIKQALLLAGVRGEDRRI